MGRTVIDFGPLEKNIKGPGKLLAQYSLAPPWERKTSPRETAERDGGLMAHTAAKTST